MFTSLLGLLGINVNKWVIYAISLVVGLAALAGVYFWWKHNVEATALLQFNNKQLEQTLKDKDEFIAKQKAISDLQFEQINDLHTQKLELSIKLDSIQEFLDSSDSIKNDRPSSAILRETIKRLKAI